MIRITEQSIVIEIPSTCPMEEVSSIQKGLLDLISNIDRSEIAKSDVQNALIYTSKLLKEMVLTSQQAATLQFQIPENSELKTAFAA